MGPQLCTILVTLDNLIIRRSCLIEKTLTSQSVHHSFNVGLYTSIRAFSNPFPGTPQLWPRTAWNASLGHSRYTQDWVCDVRRPQINHDFLTALSSQTHSFHVICHHLCPVSCPHDNSTGRSNRCSREVVFTEHTFGGTAVRKDLCPFGPILLG